MTRPETAIGSDPDADTDPRSRGQRLYDRWASHLQLYRLIERDTQSYRRRGIDSLALSGGETVVDLGCGPGSNFGMLSAAVGPSGQVIGYDYSREMVTQARRRAADNNWTNVTVEQRDVTDGPLHEEFDAATATTALSAMTEPAVAIRQIHDHLRPGGRFFVLDGILFDERPRSLLNPALERAFERVSNWTPAAAAAIPPCLRNTFEYLVLAERIPPGIGYIATVEKAG